MSISIVQNLHDLAETSLVSYANYTPGDSLTFEAAIQDADKQIGAGLTDVQAKLFADKYEFIVQQKNIDCNGFSAMLLRDKVTSKRGQVLQSSIRPFAGV